MRCSIGLPVVVGTTRGEGGLAAERVTIYIYIHYIYMYVYICAYVYIYIYFLLTNERELNDGESR